MKRLSLAFVLLVASLAGPSRAQPVRPSLDQLAAQLEEVDRQVKRARDELQLVEKQYTQRDEASEESQRNQRFSDGEVQYLLGDYAPASVLFYDLVANRDFQTNSRYPDALFYLSDSLYQLKNYLGARLYLRQLLNLRGRYYREALARYLEIAGRLNEFVGIDEYITQAQSLSGGALPPELSYVYGKWVFRREDLSLKQRVERSREAFARLAADASGPFHLQAAYFIGVGHVRLKQYDEAIAQFKSLYGQPVRDARERQVKELATLSLGRVYFEQAKYDEAIAAYSEVSQESDSFPDSLYEIAWCYIRKGDLERAKNATEILLLVAEDSVLAPDANILQATLLQKLTQYEDATSIYEQVINTYAPVRDEIDALLQVNNNPVEYFDQLLQRNDKSLDVTKLLPPAALKWAGTRQEVQQAQDITTALDSSRAGLAESRDIADRILRSLEQRGLESFPMLQEGYTRADAVDTLVTRAEQQLNGIEGQAADQYLSPDQRQNLSALRTRQEVLKQRIDTLPTTPEEVTARRERIQAKVDALSREAFKLSLEIQSGEAQIVALRKFVDDTRAQRKGKDTATDEQLFLEQVSDQQAALNEYLGELSRLQGELTLERNNADKAVSGEDSLRQEYAGLLDKERQVLSQARGSLPREASALFNRANVIRADNATLKERIGRAKGIIRERVAAQAAKLREQVLGEQRLLEAYGGDAQSMTQETRNLVGRIALESFKRVRQIFYDLVLKADVGLIDVAFQRKQERTGQIEKRGLQKDRELKALDDEFKEVLKDVE